MCTNDLLIDRLTLPAAIQPALLHLVPTLDLATETAMISASGATNGVTQHDPASKYFIHPPPNPLQMLQPLPRLTLTGSLTPVLLIMSLMILRIYPFTTITLVLPL